MRCSSVTVAIVALALFVQTANADTISCDFSSMPNAAIQFDGMLHTVQFLDTGYDFQINVSTSASLLGLYGDIEGTFSVGTISGNPLTTETAPITSLNGTLSIYDGAGNTFTANIDLKDITVVNRLFGFMDSTGETNLANISYTGLNAGLLGLKNRADPMTDLTFQFSLLERKSLTDLMTSDGLTTTTFSGSTSATPKPSSSRWVGQRLGCCLPSGAGGRPHRCFMNFVAEDGPRSHGESGGAATFSRLLIWPTPFS